MGRSYVQIPTINCSESPSYIKKKLDTLNLPIEDLICLDFTGVKLEKSSSLLFEGLYIGLFDCQETPENIQNGITKCKNDIEKNNVDWTSITIENYEDLSNYENLQRYRPKILEREKLNSKSSRMHYIEYKKKIFKRKKGIFNPKEEIIENITSDKHGLLYQNFRMNNRLINYTRYNRIMESDTYWTLNIRTTNKVEEVKLSNMDFIQF